MSPKQRLRFKVRAFVKICTVISMRLCTVASKRGLYYFKWFLMFFFTTNFQFSKSSVYKKQQGWYDMYEWFGAALCHVFYEVHWFIYVQS